MTYVKQMNNECCVDMSGSFIMGERASTECWGEYDGLIKQNNELRGDGMQCIRGA